MEDKLASLSGGKDKLADFTAKNPEVVLLIAKDREKALEQETAMLMKETAMLRDLLEAEKRILEAKTRIKDGNDSLRALLEDKITDLQGELVQIKGRTEAVCANRVVLETALLQWDRSNKKNVKGAGQRRDMFVKEELIDNNKLKPDASILLQELGRKQLVVADVDVIRDCNKLLNTYSSMAHYGTTLSTVGRNGICIGGKQPEATMLALVMLQMQQKGYFSGDLLVLDESYKNVLCTLSGGTVL